MRSKTVETEEDREAYLCTGSSPYKVGRDCKKGRENYAADGDGRRNGTEKQIIKRKMFCL